MSTTDSKRQPWQRGAVEARSVSARAGESEDDEQSLGRREVKKRRTRVLLISEALRLFTEKGYELTSIDDIARAAGVSRRTFFRYFPTKESIAFPYREERVRRFEELVARGPQSETGLDALRRAMLVMAGEFTALREQIVPLDRLALHVPELQAVSRQYDRAWEALIAQTLERDTGTSAAGQQLAQLLAGGLVGLIRTVLDLWVDSDGERNLVQLAHEAFDVLERGMLRMLGERGA
ncbi:MAG: TetR family transcriptional regulator [Deltaproteobacteria bacterium]|nr:TetR family transcriptional regulator [Deltaproteobacteria bacterium]